MSFDIFALGKSIAVLADDKGIRIRTNDPNIDVSRKETWPAEALSLPGAWKAAVQIEQLLERGLAEIHTDGFLFPYERVDDAAAEGLDLTASWVPPAPYLLKIDRYSDLGLPDFRYRYQLLEEGRPAVADRLGCFIRRVASQTVFRLESQMFALIEAMDNFNALPASARTQQHAWLTFAKVKGCAASVGAALDSTLAKVDVVVPSTIGLDMRENDDGSLSFLPTCDELGETEFQQAFERNPDVEGLYSVDRPGLGRVRIVLSDIQKEVLQRMKPVTGVRGSLKEALMENPAQVFDGLLDAIDLPYGERVIGIGEFRFVPVPRNATSPSELSGILNEPSLSADTPMEGAVGNNALEDRRATELVQSPSRNIEDSNTPVSVDVPPNERAVPETIEGQPSSGKKFLLIETHEEAVTPHFLEIARQATGTSLQFEPFQRPESLDPALQLHPHQQAGIHWLQLCRAIDDRRGVLLADDMGLGKTLQILGFLSWAIESKAFPDLSRNEPPYRPILIVVPLILLENRTWEGEMERFFRGSGSIFRPTLPLHGKTLEKFRRRGSGAETDIGKPTLDLDTLQRNRVVITNYETVRNYQHSFAYQKDGRSLWSIVVTDEAQEYKVPSSKISHALKAITSDFEIGSTGTPVENRLLDLWNIMDSLQPGLLGSAKGFTQKYENHTDAVSRNQSLQDLKQELLVQKPHAFLLRRDKAHVTSLPKKNIVRLTCDMSPEEIECHLGLIRELQSEQQRAKFLVALHRFSRMYQHPALTNSDADDLGAAELIATSSKLRRVIEECHKIRIRREKAIVFARHIAVQSLLAKVFQMEFGIPVKIINGATARGTRGAVTSTRTGILEEFKRTQGFNLIVLSPFVAGIGLTITEANHVFHYGRWWNPAVESQATDRVYRIGQDKEVFVYLPILHDSSDRIAVTFDERLDRLMEAKYSLARDFLTPLPAEDSVASELGEELFKEGATPL